MPDEADNYGLRRDERDRAVTDAISKTCLPIYISADGDIAMPTGVVDNAAMELDDIATAFHLRVADSIESVLRRSTMVDPAESFDIDFSAALSIIDQFFGLDCSFLFLTDPLRADQLTVRGSTTLKLTPFAHGIVPRFDSVFLKDSVSQKKWLELDRQRYRDDLLWGLLWQTMELGPYARGWSIMSVPVGFDPRADGANDSHPTGFLMLISGGLRCQVTNEEEQHLRLLVSQLSLAIEFGNSIRRAHDHLKEVTDRLAGAGEATQLHNIFSPLQRLELHADLMRRAIRKNDHPGQKKYLDLIRHDAWEASRFTKGILDLRKKPMPSTPRDFIDLVSAASDLERHYQDYAEAAGKLLIVRVETPTCSLAVSKSHFDEISSNLIHNAIKYGYRDTKVKLLFRRQDRHVLFDVTSYGIKIDPEDAEKIFELGYRTQDAARMEFNAVGFGLYWARKLAIKAGGHLYLASSQLDDLAKDHSVYRNTFRLRIPVRI